MSAWQFNRRTREIMRRDREIQEIENLIDLLLLRFSARALEAKDDLLDGWEERATERQAQAKDK